MYAFSDTTISIVYPYLEHRNMFFFIYIKLIVLTFVCAYGNIYLTRESVVIKLRLWHYKLIPVLPKEMLVSQWRECITIKRQWEKGTLKHRLVSYVMDYKKNYFSYYVWKIKKEMKKRNIKYQEKYYDEICDFCDIDIVDITNYPEHNDRYLKQCYYNLQEKADRGIITQEEWKKIEDLYWELDDKGYY